MKAIFRRSILFTPAILTLLVLSCTSYQIDDSHPSSDKNGNIGDCDLKVVSYEETIMPLLETKCVACHNSGSPAAGYDFSDFDVVLSSAADGSLIGSISHNQGYSPMPPGGSLDSCSINNVIAWMADLGLDSIPDDSGNGGDVTASCDPDTVYFQNTILPLIVSSCATTGCHDNASHRDGITLTDYNSILTTGKIKPGDPADSEFLESISGGEDDMMPPPPREPLTASQIEQIRTWILQGAKDNACNEGCDTTNVTFSASIWPMMQNYCTGCHSTASASGGVVISGYGDLVSLAGDGRLMGSVLYQSGYANMPPNQQLSECNINLLQKWIDEAFPE